MDLVGSVVTLILLFPVWVPLLIAILGRREPILIRWILGFAGVISGLFAGLAITRAGVPDFGGGFDGFSTRFIVIPLRAGILSFYLAFTGICLVTTLRYILVGRPRSVPAVFAGLLFVACIVSGIILAPRLF